MSYLGPGRRTFYLSAGHIHHIILREIELMAVECAGKAGAEEACQSVDTSAVGSSNSGV